MCLCGFTPGAPDFNPQSKNIQERQIKYRKLSINVLDMTGVVNDRFLS